MSLLLLLSFISQETSARNIVLSVNSRANMVNEKVWIRQRTGGVKTQEDVPGFQGRTGDVKNNNKDNKELELLACKNLFWSTFKDLPSAGFFHEIEQTVF